MNWIKEHTFLVGLGAATLVGAILLWMFGSSAANRYDEAKQSFDSAAAEASGFEKLELYPNAGNLESKKLKLQQYEQQAEKLQQAFDAFRGKDMENPTVQAFSDAIKQASEETRRAFGEDTEIAAEYFCGFEAYRTALPPGNATGILSYQLKAVKGMMMDLADAGISQLVNMHRPRLPEEDGKKFEPAKGQVARALPVEIVFQAEEAAVREFLSKLVNNRQNYLVLRSIRIANDNPLPPRSSDAKFEGRASRPVIAPGEVAPAAAEGPDFSSLFGGGDGAAAGAAAGTGPAAPVAPVPVDSSRILSQVLGKEQLRVFVRVDVLQFLDPKEVP